MRKPNGMSNRWAVMTLAVSALTMAACGGGGSSGPADEPAPTPGAPAPAPGPGAPSDPAPPPAPASVTGQYRLEPEASSADAALAAFNARGDEGHAFLGTLASVDGATGIVATGDFYLQDTAHTTSKLQYAMLALANSADAKVQQLNRQGANGFAFKLDVGFSSGSQFRSLFVKDLTKATTFSYERQPAIATLTRDGFLAQLNAAGARGFRLVGGLIVGPFGNQEAFNLYVKDSSGATYNYTFVDVAFPYGMANGEALLQRLNEMGAQGSFYLGAFLVSPAPGAGVQVFEKSSLQVGAIDYRVQASASSASLAQRQANFNENAAQGYFFLSDVATDDSAQSTMSVRNATNLRNPLTGITFP